MGFYMYCITIREKLMDDEFLTNRRQFLTAATTGGIAVFAGCEGSSGNNSSNGTPTPKTGTFGTTFDLNDTLQATATNITFRPAILYSPSGSDQTHLQNAPSKHLLAIIRVTLENVGTHSASIVPGTFQLANGGIYHTLTDGTPLSAANINGKPLTALRLSPGEQRTGWLLGHVPRSTARKTVTTIYQRDAAGTPPEIQWNAEPKQNTRALPQFSVKIFRLPDTATLGQDATATVAISNEGNKTRTFRGMVEHRTGNSGAWRGESPITAQIRSGKTVRRNVTINSSSNGSVSYRLAPFETTKTVEYVTPTFAFGNGYTTTQNVTLTLSNVQAASSVRVVPRATDKEKRITPPSGERFVLIHVNSVVVGQSEGIPFINEFSIHRESHTVESTPANSISGAQLLAPVKAPTYVSVYDPNVGETFSGYLGFSVPQQTSLSDLTIQWTSAEQSTGGTGKTARWTKGGRRSSR